MEQQQLLDQLNTYMLFDEITSISAKDIIQFILIKNWILISLLIVLVENVNRGFLLLIS